MLTCFAYIQLIKDQHILWYCTTKNSNIPYTQGVGYITVFCRVGCRVHTTHTRTLNIWYLIYKWVLNPDILNVRSYLAVGLWREALPQVKCLFLTQADARCAIDHSLAIFVTLKAKVTLIVLLYKSKSSAGRAEFQFRIWLMIRYISVY